MSSLAKRYAAALLDVATTRNAVDAVAADLEAIHSAVTGDPAVFARLTGPETSQVLRQRLLDRLVEGRHELLRNLVAALARRQRFALLGGLWPVFLELLRAARGETVGVVETARPLDEGRTAALSALAARLAGRQVHLTFRQAPEILGGLRMQIGNTLYDGSVAFALERLRRRLSTVPLA
ncbi:MAG: ATP synthase F1 subunit delta [Planctomycetes bacterium]|nr:ATP synthase F1 subunit delta [Planctomycetota bacterium]